jgi:23S rRNA U2552 (ribose-2'-O)-methylase RlmE/FtsJ
MKDYLQKKPSKLEQTMGRQLETIHYDLINLQRQITAVARSLNIKPEEFVQRMNETKETQDYLNTLNDEYKKLQDKKQAEQGTGTTEATPVEEVGTETKQE